MAANKITMASRTETLAVEKRVDEKVAVKTAVKKVRVGPVDSDVEMIDVEEGVSGGGVEVKEVVVKAEAKESEGGEKKVRGKKVLMRMSGAAREEGGEGGDEERGGKRQR
eukprot:3936155-Rhodomonas_salina.3